ncbi:MAG TPA: FAD-dependent oxidoreductase [Solirubrobacteraceae bacterium]|jgi:thioredoxin reductase (NADPH)|nr:FAD-dependent oxidoreductase [Solirubrobacteraceae bacterium]
MPRPAIVAVEQDREVLAALESQLIRRYDRDYRVVCLLDPGEARRRFAEMRDTGVEVALVLIGQSLPSGTPEELLDLVRGLHPHAKRALLVAPYAWIDPSTAGAIQTYIALGRIDYYIARPAPSQDEVFHEAVADFLLDWARERRLVPQTIHIVGEEWSGRAYELRHTLSRCATPHVFSLADSQEGRELVAKAAADPKLPLMVLPDGSVLEDPSNAEIAEVAGAPAGLDHQRFDLVIVGAGPAGLSAAVYGASDGLRTLVVDSGGIGGQAGSSSLIRNYLGFGRGVSGSRLAEEAYQQAASFGAGFLFMHRVTEIARSGNSYAVSLSDGRSVDAGAVILATGASYRRLGIPALEELEGAGVFYGGATSEAPGLAGNRVYVVGGGNSAGQAAVHLARYAREVTLIVRARSLQDGMSQYLVRAVGATPNIEVRTGTAVVGGGGEGHLQELVLERGKEEHRAVAADALFVLIGARPQTGWLPAEIARDEHGFLFTGEELLDEDWPLERRPLSLETSMPNVFAAGDIRRGSVKRVAAAVGEGASTVQLAQQLLGERANAPASAGEAAGLRIAA